MSKEASCDVLAHYTGACFAVGCCYMCLILLPFCDNIVEIDWRGFLFMRRRQQCVRLSICRQLLTFPMSGVQLEEDGDLKKLPSARHFLASAEVFAANVLRAALELLDDFPDHAVYQLGVFQSSEFLDLQQRYVEPGGLLEVWVLSC